MNLNHITIPSNEVPRAVKLYRLLGLRLIVDSAPRYVRLVCPDGGATFSIRHKERVGEGARLSAAKTRRTAEL